MLGHTVYRFGALIALKGQTPAFTAQAGFNAKPAAQGMPGYGLNQGWRPDPTGGRV